MKKIYQLIIISILTVFLSACGGGGSSSTDDTDTNTGGGDSTGGTDGTDDGTTELVTRQIVLCSESTNVEDYTTLYSEDTVVKDSEGTVVSIYHDSDGEKKVCIESGEAFVQESL